MNRMRSLVFLSALLLLSGAILADEVDFELPDLEGVTHTLSDYRGQWVVVNFWATWCRPCRAEIPDLSRLHEARDDLVVLGLAYDQASVEELTEFLQEYPASYPILRVDMSQPPAALDAPRALPTTHLVDPSGQLVHTWLGPVTSKMIQRYIKGLVRGSS